MQRAAALLLLAALPPVLSTGAPPATADRADGAALRMEFAEIWEVDQLSAVDIGHVVPTGPLDVSHSFGSVVGLNLPVWTRNVSLAALAAVKAVGAAPDWASRLDDIQGSVAVAIDVDLTVHVCTLLGLSRSLSLPLSLSLSLSLSLPLSGCVSVTRQRCG
eukprot:COSAG03_NODE_3959_length_1741_cov_2.563337_2_plen_161_part_00